MAIASNFPSIKPSLLLDFANVGRLDPRITFTRASTGTYYDGVTTAKAEENLVTYSQEFNNAAWTKFNAVVTSDDATAPDGTVTADSVVDTAANAKHQFYLASGNSTTSGVTYVASIFAKVNTANEFKLSFDIAGSSNGVFFNVNTGTIAASDAGYTGTITSVGNGWYRCSIVMTAGTTATRFFVVFTSDGSQNITYAGTGTGVYVWGAQLEQRSAVSSYTATTTQPITNYIPVLLTAQANVARFDHNPTTGEALGLLIEEQRTNNFTYSADFADAAWTKAQSSITSNTIVAPDGTLTGDKLVEDATNNVHAVQRTLAVTSGTSYTFTVFAKAAERTRILAVGGAAGFGANQAVFVLSNGTVTAVSGCTASIQSVGNGWYRCVWTATATASVSPNFFIYLENGTTISYLGDGYSGAYIWGAQVEAGAFPTSYIPTTTTALTRNADAASMTGTNFSSWYNQSASSFYAEVDNRVLGTDKRLVWITDATNTPAYGLRMASNNTFSMAAFNSGTFSAIAPGTVTIGQIKQAGAITTNDVAAVANGGTVGTASSWANFTADKLRIGSDQNNGNVLNGTIRKIAYYPLRVSDAQLQALTG